jgi:hypothetical protein
MALLLLRLADRFTALAGVSFFALFCWVYPLIRVAGGEYEGLLLAVLYVALLGYVVVLLVRRARAGGQAGASPIPPGGPP